MTESVRCQIESFIKGFYDIIPYRAIKLFDEKEFGLLLAGVKTIDIAEMK